MAQQTQEQEHDNLHRDGQRHPLPLWVRWFIVLFVPLVVIVGAILWIIQGAQAIIPIAVLTALGVLIAFSQVLLWLFPSIRHDYPTTPSTQPLQDDQPMFSHTPPSVQTHPPDLSGIGQNFTFTTIQEPGRATAEKNISEPKVDWGEAPHIGQFYGREQELAELQQWIVEDRCRVVAILGMGGVGKTALVAKLVEGMKDEFDYIFWRSLQHAQPLESILQECIQFLSDQKWTDLPKDSEAQISLLVDYLRKRRCLLMLDNVESVLKGGNFVGQYRDGYDGYGSLIWHIGEDQHQSCLILTSREKPKEIARLEGKTSPVRSLQLLGLGRLEGQEILKDKSLFGSDESWADLIQLYSGNPLALKLVSGPIREVFGGDIARFLKEEEAVVDDIHDLLDQQFYRLSEPEQEIMYWLAIEREGGSLDDLRENSVRPLSKGTLLGALDSLRRRCMIEINGATRFILQPVIMQYVTDSFVERVFEEIDTEVIRLFASHPLIKAQAKDYIRESQVRLILKPIADRLLTIHGEIEVEKKLKRILAILHETHPQKISYAGGNILNLLVHLKYNLQGYNFSHLVVRQAYLQNITLYDVNFTQANLATSVFSETFGSVLSVAFSPNGECLAAGTATGEIRLWRGPYYIPLLTCRGHTDWIRSLAFSPDGGILASGSGDQTVRLWEVSTGRCLSTLQGHSNWVRSVAFSPDGSILASGSEDQTLRLWEISTGQCLKTLQGDNRIRSIAFSPDGSMLASGSDDQTVRLWEVSTGQCLKTLQEHAKPVYSVAFSPDGSMLASGSDDQTIRLWEVSTGQCLDTLQGHNNLVRSVTFSPNGKILASGSYDQTVRLWEVSTGQCLKTLQGHNDRVSSIAFNPNGSMLASGSEDQTLRLWEINAGQCLKTLQGYANSTWSVAFSPDSRILASGSEDRTVRLWDPASGQCLRTLRGHTNPVYSVAFSPNGKMLASSSEDRTVHLWEVNADHYFETLGHPYRVYSIAFSPDSWILASGSEDRTVRLWEVDTGQCLKTLQGHTNRVWSVAFSPDGSMLASASDDQTVRLWEVSTGQCLKTLQGHTSPVWSVAFDPKGSLLASGDHHRTVRLWEVSTGQCLKTLQGHTNRIRSVAFSPSGKILASGGDDQTVRLWEVSTGECLKTLQGHTNPVCSITISPNGNILASSSDDGTVKLWDMEAIQYLKTLRSDRLYERMNIRYATGLTEAQKAILRALGAIEDEQQELTERM